MDFRQPINETPGPVALNVAIAHRGRAFIAGTEDGFKIFQASDARQVHAYEIDPPMGVGIAEMVEDSQYVGLCGGGKNALLPRNKYILWNMADKAAIHTMFYPASIEGLRINKKFIMVTFRDQVKLYKFPSKTREPPQKLAEYETERNPYGLCCLGSKVVVVLGRNAGQVRVTDLPHATNTRFFPVHNSSIRALTLSTDETLFATASEKGTLIRVWSTKDGAKIGEYRRGMDPATIYSIAISPSCLHMAVTSDKSTLHVFALPKRVEAMRAERAKAADTYAVEGKAKWGVLAELPLMPRIFTDQYSTASAPFDPGEEREYWQRGDLHAKPGQGTTAPIPGLPDGRPPKGVIGWLTDHETFVVNAGRVSYWEHFLVSQNQDGTTTLTNAGYKNYMTQDF
ncbi:SVP1-like protein 2 [Aulographum hederae CBS 113979]|uniref:SVP1-like protein 2 n=1 Tax=Aulographum hederae CBS 113979 TaxID=1176131 RepID=A0A6G1H722_9PEZI|nr:SVP1-like protein 2 [Aulographum hederae CBS 113979]